MCSTIVVMKCVFYQLVKEETYGPFAAKATPLWTGLCLTLLGLNNLKADLNYLEYLEYFSNKCGVFQTSICIPLTTWSTMMEEYAEKIQGLFASSRTSRDILLVKKTLEF